VHFDLKYGTSTLPLDIDDQQILDLIHPGDQSPLPEPSRAVERMLAEPLGTEALEDMLQKTTRTAGHGR